MPSPALQVCPSLPHAPSALWGHRLPMSPSPTRLGAPPQGQKAPGPSAGSSKVKGMRSSLANKGVNQAWEKTKGCAEVGEPDVGGASLTAGTGWE